MKGLVAQRREDVAARRKRGGVSAHHQHGRSLAELGTAAGHGGVKVRHTAGGEMAGKLRGGIRVAGGRVDDHVTLTELRAGGGQHGVDLDVGRQAEKDATATAE